MSMYQEILGHFAAGVALSFADRAFSHNSARHTPDRLEEKIKQVESLHALVESSTTDKPKGAESEREYYENVRNARRYFASKGVIVSDEKSSTFEKLQDRITHWKDHERIHIHSMKDIKNTFGLAFMAEVTGDCAVYLVHIMGGNVNATTAFMHSLYQAPSLALGLVVGKGMLYVKDSVFKSKEERELDSMAKELTYDGKVLDIVRTYSPTADLQVTKGTTQYSGGPKRAVMVDDMGIPLNDTASGSNGSQIEHMVDTAGDAMKSAVTYVGKGLDQIRDYVAHRRESRIAEEKAERERKKAIYDKY